MPLALYMDEHIKSAVTLGLRRRGVDVLTAQEDGHDHIPDPAVLDRAGALGRVVFTQDDDFLAEAHRRQVGSIPFVGVVYAHQLGPSIGRCVTDLEVLAGRETLASMADRVVYLPIR